VNLEPESTTAPFGLLEGLRKLGLTQHQGRAYLALLPLHTARPSAVAKSAQLPRPNTYEALDALVALGAATVLPGKPKSYRVTPPSDWLPAAGKSLYETANTLTEELSKVQAPKAAVPQIQGWERLAGFLREGIHGAQDCLLADARAEVFAHGAEALKSASRRGVEICLLVRGGALPFSPPAGWLVVESPQEGSKDSCWTFDGEWALRYSGLGPDARGRRLFDPAFTGGLARGILGQVALHGCYENGSPEQRMLLRMSQDA